MEAHELKRMASDSAVAGHAPSDRIFWFKISCAHAQRALHWSKKDIKFIKH